jgi:Spy/CpxP family protein refolding chaperone
MMTQRPRNDRACRQRCGLAAHGTSTNLRSPPARRRATSRHGTDTDPREDPAMTKFLIALLLTLVAAAPISGQAQAKIDYNDLTALRNAAKADKKALVASTLQLTDAEAKKFWPIYDDYQRSRDASDRQRVRAIEGVIATDKPVSDAYASSLAKDLLAADEAELRARRAMQNKLMKAIPAKKAVRYLQLENKLRAVQFYDVAGAMSLIN